jgi:hypothetical protein
LGGSLSFQLCDEIRHGLGFARPDFLKLGKKFLLVELDGVQFSHERAHRFAVVVALGTDLGQFLL